MIVVKEQIKINKLRMDVLVSDVSVYSIMWPKAWSLKV